MNLLILGAGASYGSDTQNTPPLGNDLYDALCEFAPVLWGALPEGVVAALRSDFEPGMEALLHAADSGVAEHPPTRYQWNMADFFRTQFSVRSTNLYIGLIGKVLQSGEEWVMASLNYDPLLFQAAATHGITYSICGVPPESSRLHICLPHGSSVLVPERRFDFGNPDGNRFPSGVRLDGPVLIAKDEVTFWQEMQRSPFPPVMSFIVPSKFTMTCQEFLQEERDHFAKYVHGAGVIVIVGLRVCPRDSHIWEPLASTKARILYIAGRDGKQEYDAWAREHGRTGDRSLPIFFAKAMDCIAEVLRGTDIWGNMEMREDTGTSCSTS